MGTCPRCLGGNHAWSPPGPETFGTTKLSRYRCVCDNCLGRCDGLQTRITTPPPHHPPAHRRITPTPPRDTPTR